MRINDELKDYMKDKTMISTHSHHLRDHYFSEGFDLDMLLSCSYISWSGVKFDRSSESRRSYIEKVSNKSYFVWLTKAISEIYGLQLPLNVDTWETFSDRIREAHTNKNWHIDILKNICKYEKVVLDTYWNPGENNGYGDIFTPTFRINIFLYGNDPDFEDHDGNSFFKLYGKRISDIDEYVAFIKQIIVEKINNGCVSLKCAVAYDRGIDFENVSKDKAQRAFGKAGTVAEEDVKAFQDYIFYRICDIAAELDIPLQCHTGLGKMIRSNAMQLQPVISEKPNTKFVLFHCGYPWMDDILGLLHVYPNVYPDLCWLPIISPTAAQRTICELIEVGTADKVCWGCDTWTSEESYGAVLALRHVLSEALGHMVGTGYFSKANAVEMIDRIIYKNANTLYKYGQTKA